MSVYFGPRYYFLINSFADKATEGLFHGTRSKDVRRIPGDVRRPALQRLDVLNAADSLQDLLIAPGNRLESLKGDRQGYFSIRVNDQWRIVFRWADNAVHDVQLVDYH